MSTQHNGDKIGTLATPTHQEVQMVSCTVCRKAKGRAKVEVSTVSATTVESQVIRSSSVMQKVEKQKGKKGDSQGWNDSQGWTVGKGWSEGKGWNTSGKGWEQQRPAGMNNLERDSKQYDVLMMETSTQEKTVRDGDWCVPRQTRCQTQPHERIDINQYKHATSDCLGSKQFFPERR